MDATAQLLYICTHLASDLAPGSEKLHFGAAQRIAHERCQIKVLRKQYRLCVLCDVLYRCFLEEMSYGCASHGRDHSSKPFHGPASRCFCTGEESRHVRILFRGLGVLVAHSYGYEGSVGMITVTRVGLCIRG